MLNGNEMKAFYRIFFPKRPDEGGLTARVPDVNETRLNDNFKTIGDEFRKIWEFIKNGFKTKSLTVDGDASVGGQLSAGSATLGDTNVSGTLDVDGSATFDSGVTIGGTLSVTNRRAAVNSASAGWHRVLEFAPNTATHRLGRAGLIIDFDITRFSTANETHKVSLSLIETNARFMGEESNSNTQLIDKIRYIYDNSKGYVDIHFSSSLSSYVAVDYQVSGCGAGYLAKVHTMNLADVADSPSGETVLTEYNLSANTEGNVTSSFSSSKGTFQAFRCGKMVTVAFLGNSTTWTADEVFGTIGSDVIPALSYIDVVGYIGRQAVVVRLNQTGDITLWIGSTLTGNQRLYFSFTYPIV